MAKEKKRTTNAQNSFEFSWMVRCSNFLGWCVAVITIMTLCTVALCKALNTPEVEISYSTKKCIRVVYMDGKITDCSKLPEKYDRVWVK